MTGKNVPNLHKNYQIAKNIPNVHKIFQKALKYINIFPSKALQKFSQIGIFGSKRNHLATLVGTCWNHLHYFRVRFLQGLRHLRHLNLKVLWVHSTGRR
jgi:hypothetical protein